MKEFFVTFGMQYVYEDHPKLQGAHPDKWVRITAIDELDARQIAIRELGTQWAFMYSSSVFN